MGCCTLRGLQHTNGCSTPRGCSTLRSYSTLKGMHHATASVRATCSSDASTERAPASLRPLELASEMNSIACLKFSVLPAPLSPLMTIDWQRPCEMACSMV